MEPGAISEIPVKSETESRLQIIDRRFLVIAGAVRKGIIAGCRADARTHKHLRICVLRPERFQAEEADHVELRRHGDGGLELSVKTPEKHVRLLFAVSDRSDRLGNSGEGRIAAHHDRTVRIEPVADIVAAFRGKIRGPFNMAGDNGILNLIHVVISDEPFPQFPGAAAEAALLTIHFDGLAVRRENAEAGLVCALTIASVAGVRSE